jgi:hypothetical protein
VNLSKIAPIVFFAALASGCYSSHGIGDEVEVPPGAYLIEFDSFEAVQAISFEHWLGEAGYVYRVEGGCYATSPDEDGIMHHACVVVSEVPLTFNVAVYPTTHGEPSDHRLACNLERSSELGDVRVSRDGVPLPVERVPAAWGCYYLAR